MDMFRHDAREVALNEPDEIAEEAAVKDIGAAAGVANIAYAAGNPFAM